MKRIFIIAAILFVCALPSILWPQVIPSVSALSVNSYFPSHHFVQVYVCAPLVACSTIILLLMPGLLLAFLSQPETVADWILRGFGLSLLMLSIFATIFQQFLQHTLQGSMFVGLILFLAVTSLVLVVTKKPLERAWNDSILIYAIALPALILILLTPKFYWENFNGDGAHLAESSRLLLMHPLPFWPESAGRISSYPGVSSMLSVYPVSWFMRIFGVCEASARLPFVMYLSVLFCAVISVIRHERRQQVYPMEKLLLTGHLLLFAVVVCFNVTYNPYMADIALPAARETLCMVCFLAFILSFVRNEWAWMILFLVLTFLILPTTQLLIGLWLLATFLVFRPVPWKSLIIAGLVFGGCLIANAVAPNVLAALHLPTPGREFSMQGLRYRLNFGVPVPRRILYWIVPCGILPAFSFVYWKKQDAINRALILVTIGYFLFFMFQEHTALNHFVPVMILPVIIFWRTPLMWDARYRAKLIAASALCLLLALLFSFPRHFGPDQSSRVIGASIIDKTTGYDAMQPSAFENAALLQNLFPETWMKGVPRDQCRAGRSRFVSRLQNVIHATVLF